MVILNKVQRMPSEVRRKELKKQYLGKKRVNDLTEKDIRKIVVKERIPLKPDESLVGKVSTGKVYFFGKGDKRVVIKEIETKPNTGLLVTLSNGQVVESMMSRIKRFMYLDKIVPTPEKIAEQYNLVIQDLVKAGVPLPKIRAVVHDEKLLIISPYFGNVKGTQLHKKQLNFNKLTFEQKDRLFTIFARTIDAGLVPTHDYVEFFSGSTVSGFIPIDLDFLVAYKLQIGLVPRNFDDHNKSETEKQYSKFVSLVNSAVHSVIPTNTDIVFNEVVKRMRPGALKEYFKKTGYYDASRSKNYYSVARKELDLDYYFYFAENYSMDYYNECCHFCGNGIIEFIENNAGAIRRVLANWPGAYPSVELQMRKTLGPEKCEKMLQILKRQYPEINSDNLLDYIDE